MLKLVYDLDETTIFFSRQLSIKENLPSSECASKNDTQEIMRSKSAHFNSMESC